MSVAVSVGVSVQDFWDMTPKETVTFIKSRSEYNSNRNIELAWLMAKLVRAKKLPSLSKLKGSPGPVTLKGDALKARQSEFAEMTSGLDMTKLPGARNDH